MTWENRGVLGFTQRSLMPPMPSLRRRGLFPLAMTAVYHAPPPISRVLGCAQRQFWRQKQRIRDQRENAVAQARRSPGTLFSHLHVSESLLASRRAGTP